MDIYEAVTLYFERYRGEKQIIGKSREGRSLYAFFTGTHGGAVGLSQYAIHARERITAFLGIEHIKRGVTGGGVWILPLMNPDGALLSERGLGSASQERREFLLKLNGKEDFSLWKANADGVDLNLNFPARWGTGRGNIFTPAPHGYVGSKPLCEPESRALALFTEEVAPDYTVSWHTKGEEIYWKFHQSPARARRDKRLARVLSRTTGYPLKSTPFSAGGYKDWCVESLKIPAFTVEVGSDERAHPLGFGDLPDLIDKNLEALVKLNESCRKQRSDSVTARRHEK